MKFSRRDLALAGGALVAAVALAAALLIFDRGPALVFTERADLPGFRNLVIADERGTGVTPMPPIDVTATQEPPTLDICAALFEDPDDPRLGTGAPTVVYFTDYRCPYCRVMGERLVARAQADQITLIVKQWPVLGPQSETAARAALAAARQGAFLKAHERLTLSPFVPNAAYARDIARWYRLDADRLIADFDGAETAAQLDRTAALAKALGLAGVPGLVVGRTVTMRSLNEERLDALIEAERDLGPPPC